MDWSLHSSPGPGSPKPRHLACLQPRPTGTKTAHKEPEALTRLQGAGDKPSYMRTDRLPKPPFTDSVGEGGRGESFPC